MASVDLAALDEETLAEWLLDRRWFGSKARDVGLDPRPRRRRAPRRRRRAGRSRWSRRATRAARTTSTSCCWACGVATASTTAVIDDGRRRHASTTPSPTRAACELLGGLLRDGAEVHGEHARVELPLARGRRAAAAGADVRPIGAEQSNTSIVFDDALVLKAFRRVEAGDNPELEMLRFLTERGFPHIAALGGLVPVRGRAHGRHASASCSASSPDAPRRLGAGARRARRRPRALRRRACATSARSSGACTPCWPPTPPIPPSRPRSPRDESLALLTATIDEEIERALPRPARRPRRSAPIAGRGEEVRDRLQLLVARRRARQAHPPPRRPAPRPDDAAATTDWVVLDFEGEPARPLLERRRKRSPLRDVAGHAALVRLRRLGQRACSAARPAPEGWEERAREAFLARLPRRRRPVAAAPRRGGRPRTLLSIFELEKAVYELRYELNNRPDWVRIPVAGIARLLEEPL